MKKLLLLAVALAVPMLFVTPPANASADPTPCIAQIDYLIDLVNGSEDGTIQPLIVYPASKATKVRSELTRALRQSKRYLEMGGSANYYRAGMKLRDFYGKLRIYSERGKVDHAQAVFIEGVACDAMKCIVALYNPYYVYVCPDPK